MISPAHDHTPRLLIRQALSTVDQLGPEQKIQLYREIAKLLPSDEAEAVLHLAWITQELNTQQLQFDAHKTWLLQKLNDEQAALNHFIQ